MRRYLPLSTLLAASARICLAQATAEQILDRYIAVTGGEQAYVALRNEAVKAEFTVNGSPSMEMTTYSEKSGKHFSVMNLPNGSHKQGVYGDLAWEHSSASGARILTGSERASAMRAAAFLKSVLWKAKYAKVELAGTTQCGERACYQVVLTPSEGKPETRYFDVESGLLVRVIEPAFSDGQLRDIDVQISDYRDVKGIKAAFQMEMKVGEAEVKVKILSVEYNKPLTDAVFQPPSEVRTLAASAQRGTALPNAKDLMDKHIAAIGGLEALGQLKGFRLTGTVTILGAGVSGKMVLYMGSAGESYQMMEFPGAGKVEVGNNGDVEWERTTLMGPRVRRTASRAGGLLQPTPASAAYWQAHFAKIATIGTETVSGKPCYKVEMTQANGQGTQTQCFDKDSGLLVRTSIKIPDIEAPMDMILSDYREVEGVKHAFRMVMNSAKQTIQTEVEELAPNVEMPAEMKSLPADVQALVAKRKSAAEKAAAEAEAEVERERPKLRRSR